MGKGTHLAELARVKVMWIGLAEFRFVFFWMVEVLFGVVRAWAAVALLACVLASFFVLAKSRGISAERPSSILAVCFVVIETFFVVVTQLVDARLGLKSSQIQEHYAFAVYWADGRLRIG